MRDVPAKPEASPVPDRPERLFDERARHRRTGGGGSGVKREKTRIRKQHDERASRRRRRPLASEREHRRSKAGANLQKMGVKMQKSDRE